MTYRLLSRSLLTLGTLGLTACGEPTTQPNTVEDQPSVPQLAVTSNTWLTRRDMPLDLYEQAVAVVPNATGQSILYAIGGGKADSPYNGAPIPMGEVRAYNVATNTWTSKQDMPVARWGMRAGVINGKIYVTGGFTKAGWATGAMASLFVYDPASNSWTQKRNMPAAGGGGMSGVIRGRLYVYTFNYSSGNVVNYFFRYNPTTNSWTKLPTPTTLWEAGGGVMYDKLYLIGYASGDPSRLFEYDPSTNQWAERPLPDFASGLVGTSMTVVMGARLYLFGGRDTFIYEPLSDTWQTKPLLTTFSYWDAYRLTAARVFLNGKPRVEVIGGFRDWPGSPGNNQQYIP